MLDLELTGGFSEPLDLARHWHHPHLFPLSPQPRPWPPGPCLSVSPLSVSMVAFLAWTLTPASWTPALPSSPSHKGPSTPSATPTPTPPHPHPLPWTWHWGPTPLGRPLSAALSPDFFVSLHLHPGLSETSHFLHPRSRGCGLDLGILSPRNYRFVIRISPELTDSYQRKYFETALISFMCRAMKLAAVILRF